MYCGPSSSLARRRTTPSLSGRFGVAERARQQPDHRVGDHHRRELPAGQHEVADGDLVRPQDARGCARRSPRSGRRRAPGAPTRRPYSRAVACVEALAPGATAGSRGPGRARAGCARRRAPPAPAGAASPVRPPYGTGVHRPVTVEGEVSDVIEPDVHHAPLARHASGCWYRARPGTCPGTESRDVDLHGSVQTPLAAEPGRAVHRGKRAVGDVKPPIFPEAPARTAQKSLGRGEPARTGPMACHVRRHRSREPARVVAVEPVTEGAARRLVDRRGAARPAPPEATATPIGGLRRLPHGRLLRSAAAGPVST